MNKIYNNVLNKLNNIIIDEKKIFKDLVLSSIKINKSKNIDVKEYYINNNIYYSNGNTIYIKKSNNVIPIGFEKNNIFFIFQN